MGNEDTEPWAGLKTVSSFDNGESSSLAMEVTHQELQNISPSSLLVESLIDYLCVLIDPNNQEKLYTMICRKLHEMKLIDESYCLDELQFIRNHYRRALINFVELGRASKESRDGISGAICAPKPNSLSLSLSSESLLENSRYSNEFLEIEFIAKGGFGRVYKARHKLDGSVYAVKKINLRYRNASKFLHSLKEVKMLAALHHPNIVAYKAAWLEPFYNRKSSSSHITEPVIVDEISTNSSSNSSPRNFDSTQVVDHPRSSDSSDIVFVRSSSNSPENAKSVKNSKDNLLSSEDTSTFSEKSNVVIRKKKTFSRDLSNSVFFKSSSSSSRGVEAFSLDNFLKSDSCSSSEKKDLAICMNKTGLRRLHTWNIGSNGFQKDWATLFVQMQLCEDNMRQWLDKRNRSFAPVDVPQIVSVFIKVLKGIEYIHGKGIVHHDIKPSNIFMSRDLRQVQVGDFGLACCLLTHNQSADTMLAAESEPTEHLGRVGTLLYAAPEQINGVCEAKSDIYSMGIILLELIIPFQTDMERSKVIQELKKGKMPTDLAASRPDLAKIISRTVSKSVSKRPCATELLKMINTKERKDSETIIREKDSVISQLREELMQKDAEISKLRQQLAALSSKD
ncbi:eukaryotic translation initiation factor 2-alpha kinase 1 isoform X1 [Nilaparvata lugens]|uniref:eukaryotic translation initiation factor 2-alpha kinase 1 isoform X1 n=1 Tax=Nilaparvata lugens TaxID=108931 RepID=UPI00193E4F30|nr:eukaryotic translation initiation factor 2-alpha kinase 1 isoform X1 [Nilaparvata lugens]